jgi:asparagine synthase (glutamine-hydrolysing)
VTTRFTASTMLAPHWIHSGALARLSASRAGSGCGKPPSDGRAFRAHAIMRLEGAGSSSAGSPHGADYRDPTTDLRLIDFLLSIPEDQFLRHGQTKYLLRRAMAERLSPLVLQERRKGLVGADWHLRVAPYRDRFAATLEDCASSPLLQTLLDFPRMRALIDRWPKDHWHSPRVQQEYRMGLCRAISAGLFVRYVEQGIT